MIPSLSKVSANNLGSMVQGQHSRNPQVAKAMHMGAAPAKPHFGARPHFAPGGDPRPAMMAQIGQKMHPERQPGEPIHTGALRSDVAGRTDHIPVTVPEGAYVIPADIVSHYGQGNSEAGYKVMEGMFHGDKIRGIRKVAGANKNQVPIAAAGGEYVVPPETVMRLGKGDIKRGHAILDEFVKGSRADLIKTTKALPGPKTGRN